MKGHARQIPALWLAFLAGLAASIATFPEGSLLNDHSPVAGSTEMQAERRALAEAAQRSLEQRRASGAILSYNLDGWVVREHPGGRIEQLAPIDQFRAADFPYPVPAPPGR